MHKIQFYIDPSNGLIYTQNDVDVFVNKFKIPTDDQTFLPYTHQQWLGRYLDALIQTYQASHETEKVDELSRLRALAQED